MTSALVQSPAAYGALYTCALRVARAACERGAAQGAGAGGVAHAAAALCAALRAARPALAQLTPASLWQAREALEHLSNLLEVRRRAPPGGSREPPVTRYVCLQFAGVLTYVLGVCREGATPSNSKKSGKKKPSVSPERAATGRALGEAAGEAAALLGEARARLDCWHAAWAAPQLASDMDELLAGVGGAGGAAQYSCPVAGQLERSYREALRHARDTLDDKIKYLKSMQ